MSSLDTFTQAKAQKLFEKTVWRRGYKLSTKVETPIRQQERLAGKVRSGSRLYTVMVEIGEGTVGYRCDCNETTICKHIAALFHYWYRWPQNVQVMAKAAPDTVPRAWAKSWEPEDITPDWQTSFVARHREREKKVWVEGLTAVRVAELRDWAKRAGWQLTGTRTVVLAEQVYDHWQKDLVGLNKNWQRLSVPCQLIWRAIATLGRDHETSWEDVEQLVNLWGHEFPRQMTAELYQQELIENGLILPGDLWDDSEYWQPDLMIPSFVRQALPTPLSGVVPTVPVTALKGEVRLGDPHRWLQAMQKGLQVIEERPLALGDMWPKWQKEEKYPFLRGWNYSVVEAKAVLGKGDLRYQNDLFMQMLPPKPFLSPAAQAALADIVGSPEAAEYLWVILQGMRLVKPGTPITLWSKWCVEFWQRGLSEQWAYALRAVWQSVDYYAWWAEWRADASLKLHRRVSKHMGTDNVWLRTLFMARRTVLHVLSCLPEGSWISWADIRPVLQIAWPVWGDVWYESSHYYEPSDWLTLAKDGRELDGEGDLDDWEVGQGAFIRRLITGPLHWLGAADIVVDKTGRLQGFRLQGLKSIFWDQVDSWPLPAPQDETLAAAQIADGVTIKENQLEVGTASMALARSFLEQIARLEKATAQKFVYEIDVATVWHSFEKGVTLGQLETGWQAALQRPFTGQIAQQIQTWWAQYGQIRLYQKVTVIQFGDAYARQEMAAVTSLAERVVLSLSPQAVVIAAADVAELVAELEKAGYTPKVTGQVNDE